MGIGETGALGGGDGHTRDSGSDCRLMRRLLPEDSSYEVEEEEEVCCG